MGNDRLLKTPDRAFRYSIYDFIAAVQQRPQLWRRDDEGFHSREKREQAWMEVARCLHNKFEDLSPAEKRKIVMLLIKSWKNTRDSYYRARRRLAEKRDDEYTKTYVYEKEMSFLLNNGEGSTKVEPANSDDTFSGTAMESRMDIGGVGVGGGGGDAGVSNSVGNIGSRRRGRSTRTRQKKRPRFSTVSPTPTVTDPTSLLQEVLGAADVLEDPLDGQDASEAAESMHNELAATLPQPMEADADLAFFESIKPVLSTMSVDQRLDFQIAVLQLLKVFREKK